MAQQQAPQMQPAQANAIARNLVINQSVERIQQIYSQTLNGANQQGPIAINPRNVGLLKGFFVDVVASVTNPNASAFTLTPFGAANILSQIKFDDLQNNTRIQTTGWHVHLVNSVRNQRPWGLSTPISGSAIGYGENYDVISATIPAISSGTAGTVKMRYYVPIAYSNDDLRGAIYANVVNATMQLSLTLNPNVAAVGTAANIAANFNSSVYSGSAGSVAGVLGNVTITVYQHYLDQLPMSQQGPILPMLDLQTIYELKNTTMTGVSANQDYTVPYANFRTFLSTVAVWDNNLTPGFANGGTDVNYWALRSANFTDILKMSPIETSLLGRLAIGVDLPGSSTYYFNHRNKPINTIQYGNMELVLNASSIPANSPARVMVGYEDFAMINVVSGAGSLPAGG